MSRVAEESLRCLGKEFHKMSADEKKLFLSKLETQKEYEKIQSEMNLEEGEEKLTELKREIILMD